MWQLDIGFLQYRKITLENGILKPSEPSTEKDIGILLPFRDLTLPTEFAKVHDAKSAISFERKYTQLGRDQLVADFMKEWTDGDPLDWVLEHARFVRFALNLEYGLAKGDNQLLINQINAKKKKATSPRGYDQITYPVGAYSNERLFSLRSHTGTGLVWLAQSILANIVTDNTKNIHQELEHRHEGLIWIRKVRALIEVIWSMVGDLAVKTQPESEKRYFRRCKFCDTPFLGNDGRQLFCPPEEGLAGRKQSLCGLQYRQRKLKKEPN